MDLQSETLKPELRVSPRLVVVVLATLSVAMIAGAQLQEEPRLWSRFLDLGLVLGGTALVGWLLTYVQPLAAKWWPVCAALAAVVLGAHWLELPSVLFLMFVPVLLSGALIGLLGAAATALAETLVLFLSPALLHVGLDAAGVAIALTGIWIVLGALIAIYRPIYALGDWLQRYLDSAEQVVEQARDRKAQLEMYASVREMHACICAAQHACLLYRGAITWSSNPTSSRLRRAWRPSGRTSASGGRRSR